MEALIPYYQLPPKAVYEAVDALGIISLHYRHKQGEEAQKQYLLEQYMGYRSTCEQRRLSRQQTQSAAEPLPGQGP
jgi:hypothetical protein